MGRELRTTRPVNPLSRVRPYAHIHDDGKPLCREITPTGWHDAPTGYAKICPECDRILGGRHGA